MIGWVLKTDFSKDILAIKTDVKQLCKRFCIAMQVKIEEDEFEERFKTCEI